MESSYNSNNRVKGIMLLVNPFHKIAGAHALVAGIVIITVTTLLALRFDTHFNGLLEIKYGTSVYGIQTHLLYGVVNLLTISLLFYISGTILSTSSIRFIDVIGTQALARFPYFFAPFLNINSVMERLTEKLLDFALGIENGTEPFTAGEMALFISISIALIIVIAWYIALMYNAYRISCNIGGTRAVLSFIIVLIVAVIVSILINQLHMNYLIPLQ